MSFWELSDGEDLRKSDEKEFSVGGPIELIPAQTSLLACIDEAKWTTNADQKRYIELRWTSLAPESLKNRKVYQKLWVDDLDDSSKDPVKKRDKAKRMLRAIDSNAGSKLSATDGFPSDEVLTMCLTNKPMVIRVDIWESARDGQLARGNYVQAVAPKGSNVSSDKDVAAGVEKMQAAGTSSKGGGSNYTPGGGRTSSLGDDEIPF